MSPELIQMGIIILVVLIVVKVLFSAGKKLISFIISAIFSVYLFVNYVWPFIEALVS